MRVSMDFPTPTHCIAQFGGERKDFHGETYFETANAAHEWLQAMLKTWHELRSHQGEPRE